MLGFKSENKHLKRVNSITQSGSSEERLDTSLGKATKMTRSRLTATLPSFDFLEHSDFPDYIGYYFRKAYEQVGLLV